MRVLLSWGQRPEWERDGRHLLFMEKAFGHAHRLDIETGEIVPLTTHFFHDGFDRILALANGDYLLTGTRDFSAADPWKHRQRWKIDIYRVALDGSHRADRLTFFDDLGGPYHGSNPVVSPDGRFTVVQLGIHGMGAGQGRGLVLIGLGAWERTFAADETRP